MDQDGDPISTGMLGGDDAGDFKISDDGVLDVQEYTPNYEGPADKPTRTTCTWCR